MRLTEEQYAALIHKQAIASYLAPKTVEKPLKSEKSGQPNKTESEYGRMLALEFPGAYISFEGLSFKLKNGHRYTPDWVVNVGNGEVVCVEVKARGKNGFRHASYQRARVMFDQCLVEWPNYTWRWAEKSQGTWS